MWFPESTAVSEINTGETLTGDRVFVEKEEVVAFAIPLEQKNEGNLGQRMRSWITIKEKEKVTK